MEKKFFKGLCCLKNKQMSESLLTASMLSISGGLQDVYTYISRGHVFANAQTGNIVLLSQNLFDHQWGQAIHYLVPVLFFSFGIAITTYIRQFFQKYKRFHWRQIVLLIEIVLLFVVGFMPDDMNLIANALVSFSCAMQVQAFRKVNSYAFASTMCIGNLRSGTESLSIYLRDRNIGALKKTAHYYGIILIFAIGAGIGGVCSLHIGIRAIWGSSVLLAIVCAMMVREHR